MKSFIQITSLFVAATGSVFAAGSVPEPGSLALVGLAVAGLVFVAAKKKK